MSDTVGVNVVTWFTNRRQGNDVIYVAPTNIPAVGDLMTYRRRSTGQEVTVKVVERHLSVPLHDDTQRWSLRCSEYQGPMF